MKMAYGVPVPSGAHKDWEASSMTKDSGGLYLRRFSVPADWGDPTACVGWFDRLQRCRACVAHYGNGRAVLLRADMNGKWKLSFGNAPASVDERSKSQDQQGLGPKDASAVPAQQGDAQ